MVAMTLRVQAQSVPLDTAIQGLTLQASTGGTNNKSGMAFNPNVNLYYAVNAGDSEYPSNTFNLQGALLDSTPQGFDYRGAWWNPLTSQFEGNGFSNLGIFVQTLAAGTGYPTGMGSIPLASAQPNNQSVGDLDDDLNEIIYYDDGYIFRYTRATNQLISQSLIVDLPVNTTSINNNTVVYTGIPGAEIGLYDYVNQRVLLVNKLNATYSGACQLPASAPQRSSFGASFANDLFWLFDQGTWFSYEISETMNTSMAPPLTARVKVYPNPTQAQLQVEIQGLPNARRVLVRNLMGQVCLVSEMKGLSHLALSTDELPAGLYEVTVITEEGSVTQKVWKQ
jgi:phage baseplate assembly protein gpV